MIGNDIVDLQQAEQDSNWRRTGYLEKIFTKEEQERILHAAEPAKMVWLQWSMKESAYKILHRQTRIQRFAPKSLECTRVSPMGSGFSGWVRSGDQIYYTRASFQWPCLHTLAVQEITFFERLKIYVKEGYKSDYNTLILEDEILDEACYLAKDTDNIPYIRNRRTGQESPVSISHHGNFFGMVYV